MKKVLMVLAIVLGAVMASNAANSSYFVNDANVDQVFAAATEVAISNISLDAVSANATTTMPSFNAGNDPVIAFLLCWFLGGFGIHRHYLGTKGSMWAIYFFTCGGIFGIVYTVDWIVLLVDGIINKNIDKYTNNEKFFMWS